MNTNTKPYQIINALVTIEEAASRLYGAYSTAFPEYTQFWHSLSKDEDAHARLLNQFHSFIDSGLEMKIPMNLNLAPLERFAGYITEETARVLRRERSLLNALSIAQYIEDSMIERDYFRFTPEDAPEIRQVLSRLTEDTWMHMNRVRWTLTEYKKNHPV